MVGINLIDNARKAINVYCKKMGYEQASEIEVKPTSAGCGLGVSAVDKSGCEHMIRVSIEDGGLYPFLKDKCEMDVKISELFKEGE